MFQLKSFAWVLPVAFAMSLGSSLPALSAADPGDTTTLEARIAIDPAAVLRELDQADPTLAPAQVQYLRSKALQQLGRPKEAIDAARRALALDAGVSRYHTQYASALLRRISKETMFAMTHTGRFYKALDKAIALDPKDGEPRLFKTLFLLNAPAIVGGGRDKAEAEHKKLAAVDEAYGILAQLQFLRADKKTAEAAPLYRRLLELDPDNIGYAFRYAQHLRRHDQIDAALALTDNQLAAHPDALRLIYARAVAQIHGDRDLPAGVTALERYIREQKPHAVGPLPANAWYWIGVAHQKSGRVDQARAAYQKVLSVIPKHRAAQQKLAELDS